MAENLPFTTTSLIHHGVAPMFLTPWLRSLQSTVAKSRRFIGRSRHNQRRSPALACLERLEDRSLLTITLTFSGLNGSLNLNDTVGTADSLAITQAGTSLIVQLNSGVFAAGSTPSGATIQYRDSLGFGTTPASNNAVTAVIANAAVAPASFGVFVNLFSGNDTLDISNTPGSPTRIGALFVTGGTGVDTINFGTLDLTATGAAPVQVQAENIQQAASSTGVFISGNAVFDNGGQNGIIDFPQIANTFQGTVTALGGSNNVAIAASSNLILDDITAGALDLSVAGVRTVTQNAGSLIVVSSITDVDAPNSTVTLTQAPNDFNNFRIAADTATILESDGFTFSNANNLGTVATTKLTATTARLDITGDVAAGTLNFTTTSGDIDDLTAGLLNVTLSSTFTTPIANDLRLTRAHTLHGASGKVTVTTTNNLILNSAGNLNVDLPSVLGTATLNSGGNLTDDAAGSINIAGNANVTAAGNIQLDNGNTDFNGVLTIPNSKSILIVEKDSLTLGTTLSTGSVDITANKTSVAGENQLVLSGNLNAGSVTLAVNETSAGINDDNIVIGNAAIQTTTGNITLTAADSVIVGQSTGLFAGTTGKQSVNINVDTTSNDASGGAFTLLGTVIASRMNVSGGPDGDRIDVSRLTSSLASLSGVGGDDTLLGGDLADTIVGGDGNDSIVAGNGADSTDGGLGDDYILAGLNNDPIVTESVMSGDGNDTIDLQYQAGVFVIDAGNNDDTILLQDIGNGQPGKLTIDAGTGNDLISVTPLKNAAINVDGGSPVVAPGDTLLINLTSIAKGEAIVPGSPTPSGSVTFTGAAATANYQPITWTSIEDFLANDNPNPVFNADGLASDPPLVPTNVGNGIPDDFTISTQNGIALITNDRSASIFSKRLPLAGLKSIQINGSSDADFLTLDAGLLPAGLSIVFNGDIAANESSQVDSLQFIGGGDTSSIVYRPTTPDLGNGTGTLSSGGNLILSKLEVVQFEGFGGVSVVPVDSANNYELNTSTTIDLFSPAISVSSVGAPVGSGSMLIAQGSATRIDTAFDLGLNDGANSADTMTVRNNVLRHVAGLRSLNVALGTGTDNFVIEDGDFELPVLGSGITVDGGSGTDIVTAIAQSAVSDPEEDDVNFRLATSGAVSGSASLVSTASAFTKASVINLQGFNGEHAVLTGNETDNVFDLSGWGFFATANVLGGAGSDFLTAQDSSSNLWTITGQNQGNVGGFDFSSVENLNGGVTSNDTFTFTIPGSVDGRITAGGGIDTLNFAAYVQPLTVSLLSADPTGHQGATSRATGNVPVGGGFVGIDSLVGGSSGTDALIGRDTDSVWDLNGNNTVTRIVRNDENGDSVITNADLLIQLTKPLITVTPSLAFTSFENLTGGRLADVFRVTGTVANQIVGGVGDDVLQFQDTFSNLVGAFTGGVGSDILDYRNYSFSRDVVLSSDDSNGFSGSESAVTQGFSGVDRVIGSFATADSVRGLDRTYDISGSPIPRPGQWLIDGKNRGAYTDTATGITLAIGDPTDSNGVRGAENFLGGNDFDTFVFQNGGSLGGSIDGGTNAQGLTPTYDTIVGDGSRSSEQFVVDAIGGGTLRDGANAILGNRFNNIETLLGGAGIDTFTFTNTGSLQGPIDGVGGRDLLVGDNDGNDFSVTGPDSGTLLGKIDTLDTSAFDFQNIESLSGGSGTDRFQIAALIVGDISGLGGTDTFTFTDAGQIFGILAGGAGTDSLVASTTVNAIINVFGTTSAGSAVSAVGRGAFVNKAPLFTDIENITGGDGNDSITFDNYGSISGTVNGGAGNDTLTGDDDGNVFSVSKANQGSLLTKLASFLSIENLTGGGGDDSFTITAELGDSAIAGSGNVVGLVGNDSVVVGTTGLIRGNVSTGELNDTIDLRGRIVGSVDTGIDNDSFVLQQGARIDGQATGGGGDDNFAISGVITLGFELRGGSGNDTFALTVAGGLNQQINGEDGTDTLVGDDDGNAFAVNSTNAGLLPGHFTDSNASQDFFNIESLTGGLLADTFAINANLGGTVSGLGGNDTITVAGQVTIGGGLLGGDNDDTIAVNAGTAGTPSHVEGNIDGGEGADAIVVGDATTVSATSVIRGAGGIDTLTFDYTGSVGRVLVVEGGTTSPAAAEADKIVLTGSYAGSTTSYTVGANATSGTLVTSGGSATQTVSFVTTENLSINNVGAALVVNGSTKADVINVKDAVLPATRVEFRTSAAPTVDAFAPITFTRVAGLTVTINADDGNDTINIDNPGVTLVSDLNVNGDAGNDTINVFASHRGTLHGNAGNDTFVFSNGKTLSGILDGDDGTDTLNASAYGAPLSAALLSDSPDGFSGTEAALVSGGQFVDIDSIVGGTGSDTLANGIGGSVDWEIDGSNRFYDTTTLAAVSFSSFESLVGGSGVDRFGLTGARSATINGGGGDDQLIYNNSASLTGSFDGGNGTDELSFAGTPGGFAGNATAGVSYVTGRDVVLTANSAAGYNGTASGLSAGFVQVESLRGGSGVDSLTGLNLKSTWDLDGSDRYIEDATSREIGFTGIETLNGRDFVDTFEVKDTMATVRTLNGGAADDLFRFGDGTASVDTVVVDGSTESDTVTFAPWTSAVAVTAGAFANVEELIGGQAMADSLLGGAAGDVFNITDADSGDVNSVAFSAFENVKGRGGDDQITFQGTGSLTGVADGGDGTDSLNLSNLPGVLTVTLTALSTTDGFSGNQAAMGGFANINALSGTGSDSIRGLDVAATWSLNATDSYTSSGRSLAIGGFQTLLGGSGTDTFNVVTNSSRTIDGGAGNDLVSVASGITLNGAPFGGADNDQFDLGTGAIVTGKVDGGSGNDTVSFTTSTTAVTFAVTALGSTDGFVGTVIGLPSGFDNIDTVGGSAATTDSFTGRNSDSIWDLDGTNTLVSPSTYTDSGLGRSLDFFGIENLNGGNQRDTFNVAGTQVANISGGANDDNVNFINNTAQITGSVSGGTGTNSLGFTGLTTTAANVTLTGNTIDGFAGNAVALISGGFTGIDSVTGGAATDTLTGLNVNATFLVDPIGNSYRDNVTVRFLGFTAFENLTGGSATDTFLINAPLGGNIVGNGSGDVVDVQPTGSVGGNVLTGDGIDEIFFHRGAGFGTILAPRTLDTGNDADLIQVEYDGVLQRGFIINGGAGSDELRLIGGEPAPASVSSGSFAVGASASQGVISTIIDGVEQRITFDGFAPTGDNINDRQTIDSFTISGSTGADTINVVDGLPNFSKVNFNGAFSPISFQNKARLDVRGLNNNDVINLNNPNKAAGLVVTNVNGGTGADTINVLVSNTGDLVGADGDDKFVISDGVSLIGDTNNVIQGAAGSDTIDLSVVTLAQTVQLLSTTANGFTGNSSQLLPTLGNQFTGIDVVRGSSANDQLLGLNSNATWRVNGSNAYVESATNRSVAFSSFEVLKGGTANDTFRINGQQTLDIDDASGSNTYLFESDSAQLVGGIIGGAGSDVLDFTGVTAGVDVTLSGVIVGEGFNGGVTNAGDALTARITSGFLSVNALLAGSGVDSLTGRNVASTWDIDGTNSYTSGGETLAFSGVNDLHGGSSTDTFNISGAQTINLTAGDGNDSVVFADGAALIGSADGGDPSTAPGDTLDYSAYLNPTVISLDGFTNFETLISGTPTDTLAGTNGDDIFEISGTDSGTINGVAFSGFANLDGLTGDDSFTFTNDVANLSGKIEGGGGLDTLSFSGVTASSVGINLLAVSLIDGFDGDDAGAIVNGFSNINNLVGGGMTDTLNGLPVDSDWTIDVAGGSYAVGTEILGVLGFETFNGGIGKDSFQVTSSFTGTITTNEGTDSVELFAFTTMTGDISLGDDDDVLKLGDQARVTGLVLFGQGNDQLDLSNTFENQTVTLSAAAAVSGFDGGLTSATGGIGGGFLGLESVKGGAGVDTLVGLASDSSWAIGGNSTYTSSGRSLDFTGIDNAQGGAGIDTFAVGSSVTINLLGGANNDLFNVASGAAVTGTLSGEDGNDTFSFSTIIQIANTVFDGGANDDTVSFAAGVTAVSLKLTNILNVETVIGTSQSDTLVGTSAADVFNITGADNQGSIGGTVLNFQSFENLQGGAGNDSFIFADGLGVSGSIDGGINTDTLDYSAYVAGVSVNLVTNAASHVGGTTTNVENAVGGSGADSLTGNSGANSLVGGIGNDTLTDGSGNDTLDGGSNNDTYVLTPGSADVLSDSDGVDLLDFSQSVGPIVINLDISTAQAVRGAHTLALGGTFENFIGSPANDSVTARDLGSPRSINGNGGDDTFKSGDNSVHNWQITGSNAGSVGNTTFTAIENLTGGSDDDAFVFANGASLTGKIDGGGQTTKDTLNYGASASAVTIDLGTLTSIEEIIGSLSNGNDTLLASAATSFTINAKNAGLAGSIAFANIENLTGSTSNDIFTFTSTGSLTGTAGVNGNSGTTDSLVLSTLDESIVLTDPSTTGFKGSVSAPSTVTNFTNINSINGGNGNDTLTGDDAIAAWGVAATNDYVSNGRTTAFSAIENLVGGSGEDAFSVSGARTVNINGAGGNDVFNFASGSQLTGVVDGSTGSDSLRFGGVTGRNIVLVGAGSTDGFSGSATDNNASQVPTFDNINSVEGGTGSDTLTGTGAPATFNLNSLGNSYVDSKGSLTFSSINDLVGSTNADTFNISGPHTVNINAGGGNDAILFLNANASINGKIDGGTGSDDRLDYSAISTPVVGSTDSLTGIERIVGGTGAFDTLNGSVAGSLFAINGANSGTVDTITFTGWETLAGSAGPDIFDFGPSGSVGAVFGGSGNDVIDAADKALGVAVTLNSNGLAGYNGTLVAGSTTNFTGIDTFVGSTAGTDSLTGVSSDSVWNLNGAVANQTYVNASITATFRSFESLVGRTGADTFNLDGTLNVALAGGAGNDRFIFKSGSKLNGTIQGASGIDVVDTSAISVAQSFTVVNTGSIDGFNLTNAASLFTNAFNVDVVAAGAGADTLTGLSQNSEWSVGATDSYSTGGRTLSYSGIETRQGGTAIDTFNVQADAITQTTNTLNGGSGGDIFNMNFAAGASVRSTVALTIIGSASSSSLVNADTVNVNVNAVGSGARALGLAYNSTTAGNVRVTGLGGSGGAVSFLTIEKLNINGDTANNDSVTVTGTAAADLLTVTPTANGASVLLNGSGSGVAGGSFGPDITLSGLSTNGFTVSGNAPTSLPGDTLGFAGTGTVTLTSLTSGKITQTGLVTVNFNGIEDLDPLNAITFNIDALTQANDGTGDNFNVGLIAGRINVDVNGTTVLNEDAADIAGLNINGSNDDDTLTVDLSAGSPIPAGSINFAGSSQTTADSLRVTSAGASKATYTPSGTTSGSGKIVIDGGTINMTGTEPVSFNGLNSLTVVTPNGADNLTVDSPSANVDRVAGTSGGIAFSSVSFSAVANVTIDAATNGGTAADSVTFSGNLSAAASSLTVNTGNGTDTINAAAVLSRGLTIATNGGDDFIIGGGGNDSIDGGTGNDTISQAANGTQTLTNTSLTGAGNDGLTSIEIGILTGGVGADVINAATFTGTTTIFGLDGNDTITGGLGVDSISGGADNDSILGQAGNDTLNGDAGNDVLGGGDGGDSISGGAGSDTITGNAGSDALDGGADNDVLSESGALRFVMTNTSLTGLGTDVLSGFEFALLTLGATSGTIDVSGFTSALGTTLTGGAGNDTIIGSLAGDLITGASGSDVIDAGAGNDSIYGGAGNDSIVGGIGNDSMRGNAGNDSLTGGLGDDTIDGTDGTDILIEVGDVNFTLTDASLTGLGNDTLSLIEQAFLTGGGLANIMDASGFTGSTTLTGGSGDDSLTGGSGADVLVGGVGNDSLSGGLGNDSITGNSGNDAVVGGGGTDTVIVSVDGNITLTDTSVVGDGTDSLNGVENAQLTGGAGNNTISALGSTLKTTLNGGAGDDILIGGNSDDLFNGGDGFDSISASGTNIVLTDASFSASSGSDQLVSIESVRLVAGATASLLDASGYTLGSVTLIGGAGNDTLIGGAKNDSITGNGGNDTIVGNGGDDTLFGSAGLDTIDGGAGNDVLNGGDDADNLTGQAGNDQIVGGAGNDQIDAGDGDDSVMANSGLDTIHGGAGNDMLDGGESNDLIFGDDGDDLIYGQDGDDGINGGLGNDNISGNGGRDTLLGLGGNDTLTGGSDDDTLIGGDGDDKLTGGAGVDKMAGNAGVDVIVGSASEIDEAFTESRFPGLL